MNKRHRLNHSGPRRNMSKAAQARRAIRQQDPGAGHGYAFRGGKR